MSTIDKVGIKERLIEAIDREQLPNREAARLLNIHPCYVSMIKNEKSWDGITSKVWDRFNEWFLTRDMLVNFQIPEGEEIYKQKEKEVKPILENTGIALLTGIALKKMENAEKKKAAEKLPKQAIYTEQFVAGLNAEISSKDEIIKKQEKEIGELVCLTKINPADPPSFTEAIRQKFALDIEINLVINGQRVQL